MEPDTASKIPDPGFEDSVAPTTVPADLPNEDNALAVTANAAHEVNGVKIHSNSDATLHTIPTLEAKSSVPTLDTTAKPEAQATHETKPLEAQSPLPPSESDPAIKQPVSDLRQPTELVSADVATEIKELKLQQDLVVDAMLANGLAEDGDARIQGSLASDAPPISEDLMDVDPPTRTNPPQGSDIQSTRVEAGLDTSIPHHPAPASAEEQVPDVPADAIQTSTSEPLPSIEESTSTLVATVVTNNQPEVEEPPTIQYKVSHPRDEEISDNEPASKRIKGQNPQATPEFKVPDPPVQQSAAEDVHMSDAPDVTRTSRTASDAPAPAPTSTILAPSGKSVLPRPADREDNPSFHLPITAPQRKHLQRGLTNMKKSQHAPNFTAPVDHIALNIPNYPNLVERPMDLKTMDQKLKEDGYTTIADYARDFDQIVTNTVIFNGDSHDVTQHAFHLRVAFDRNLATLPPREFAEPSAAEKKAKKAAVPKPPPRRESRSSLGNAKSPTAGSPQTTFALGPSGVPLIRRDSTVADGRPKREIHPPAPKDLPYSASKPKRKKFQQELKFCYDVLNEMKKAKYSHFSYPFQQPVDPVSLNIPNYHKVIKRPMDISTVDVKLNSGQYENAKEFEADVRLMFQNCYKFNPPDHAIHRFGKDYEKVFDEKWSQKAKWLNDHAPTSEAQSPSFSEADEDDEDDEAQEEEEEDDNNDQIAELQKSIMAISQQIDTLKKGKKKSPAAGSKKSKGAKATKKEPKKAQPKSNKKSTAKKSHQKVPIMSYEEKRAISDRINELPEGKTGQVLQLIRDNMPALKGAQEEEIELDIDELDDNVLYKLLTFVKKHAPRPEDKVVQTASSAAATTTSRPKKNKPMNKAEQEAQIEELRGKLSGLQEKAGAGFGSPGDSSQAAGNEADTSGDDASEESEED